MINRVPSHCASRPRTVRSDGRRRPRDDARGPPRTADAVPPTPLAPLPMRALPATRALPLERVRVSGALRAFDRDDSRLCSHAVKQVFVQESQLRKSTRPRPASPRSLHIDPRSPSTRCKRVCSTAWRPAYAVAAASCQWSRLVVPVAAPARWRGEIRVRYLDVAAWPHLTSSCPRRGKKEDRQGARHDRVPQVPRQLVLQLGKLLCRNQPFAAAIYLVFAQGKAASPEKLKHEAAVAALTAQIQLIELEASQRDPLF
uniref:Uncharacterized protein n=1 Tax=Pelagomonas calceolata TaxID=35677 RepID=A0A7S3ZVD4_9STRA